MLSPNASTSLDWLFENSIRENSGADSDSQCVISSIANPPPPSTLEKRKLVVLNISSYLFRIVVMAEFDEKDTTIVMLAKALRRPEKELVGQDLLDAYAEFVNMIGGTVNRNLSNEFRHVGMSTPFFVDAICAHHLSALNPAFTQSLAVSINQSAQFNLTFCVCITQAKTSTQKLLDFTVDRTHEQAQSTGELELF